MDECTICYNSNNLIRSECNHQACEDCWVKIFRKKSVCPFCRKSIHTWMKKTFNIPELKTIDYNTSFENLQFSTSTLITIQDFFQDRNYALNDASRIYCNCGSVVKSEGYKRHLTTYKHQNYEKNNYN